VTTATPADRGPAPADPERDAPTERQPAPGIAARWPYLTAEVPAVPGTIKRFYEDFVVDEVPLVEPEGRGDHVHFRIEKLGLSTPRAIGDIARALGVPPGSIGAAGLKDARAVTRQTLSVEHVDPARIEALEIPRIRILSVARHPRKLRTGQLRANRFTIRLRETDPARLDDVRRVLDILARRGVPDYFGPQRFGSRGDTGEVGRALILGDWQGAVDRIAGSPGPADSGAILEARTLFAEGRYREAAEAWPRGYGHVARLCRAMAREKGDARRALHALDKSMLRFYVQAFQSWLFNDVLARRIDSIDRLEDGDVALKHDSGVTFLVEDAAAEQPRADRFEISPTGPLFGPKMRAPMGRPAEIERDVLAAAGVRAEDFPSTGPFRVSGARRPLRFPVEEPSVEPGEDDAGPYLEFRFTLPPGAYATALLREICKDRLIEGPDDATDGSPG
jgi:tRNA pseudouridine13 synthase